MEGSGQHSMRGIILSVVCVLIVGAIIFFIYNRTRNASPGAQDRVTKLAVGLSVNEYNGRTAGFSINPPDGWTPDASIPTIHITFVNPVPDTDELGQFKANMNIATQPAPNTSLEDFMTTTKQNQESVLINYQELSNDPITVNGKQGRLVEATFLNNNRLLHIVQFITLHKGNAFIVTGTAIEPSWTKHQAVMIGSVKTLKLAP